MKSLYFFLFADFLTSLASGYTFLGLNYFAIEQTGSAAILAYSILFGTLISLILTPTIGKFLDSYSRKKITVTLQVIRGVLFITLGLFKNYIHDIMFLFIFSFIVNVGWSFYISISRTFLSSIDTNYSFIKRNSLVETTLQMGFIICGPLLAITYEKIFSFSQLLIFDGLLFLLTSFAYILVKEELDSTYKRDVGSKKLIINKITYLFIKDIFSNKVYITFALGLAIVSSALLASNVALSYYVQNDLKADVTVYGSGDMFYGIGASISGAVILLLGRKLSNYTITVLLLVVLTLCLLGFVSYNIVYLFFMIKVFYGITFSGLRSILNTQIMEYLPNKLLGRYLSILNIIQLLLQGVITLIIGWLLDINKSSLTSFLLLFVLIMTVLISYSIYIKPKAYKV